VDDAAAHPQPLLRERAEVPRLDLRVQLDPDGLRVLARGTAPL
jgi:hypothetical protein